MLRTDGDLLAEFSCLDPLYVDGIAGLVNLGDTFATCFFRWAAAKAEGGLIVQERMPAVYLVRPRASITCSAGIS